MGGASRKRTGLYKALSVSRTSGALTRKSDARASSCKGLVAARIPGRHWGGGRRNRRGMAWEEKPKILLN